MTSSVRHSLQHDADAEYGNVWVHMKRQHAPTQQIPPFTVLLRAQCSPCQRKTNTMDPDGNLQHLNHTQR